MTSLLVPSVACLAGARLDAACGYRRALSFCIKRSSSPVTAGHNARVRADNFCKISGKNLRQRRLKDFCVRATSLSKDSDESQDGELDGKFAPIDTESDFRLGPEVVLLVGFTEAEFDMVESFVKGIGAEFLEVKLCSNRMMKGTLMQALSAPADSWEQEGIATPPQRVIFLSGLSGIEIIEFVEMFQDECTYIPSPAFAAAVQRNVNKQMAQLLEEVWGDHTSAGGSAT